MKLKLLLMFMLALVLTIPVKGQVFSENFSGSAFPDNWRTQSSSTNTWTIKGSVTGGSAHSAPYFAGIQAPMYNSSNNSRIFTSGFELTSGQSYRISFWRAIYSYGNSYTAKLDVSIGSDTTLNGTQMQSVFSDEQTMTSASSFQTASPLVWEKITKYYSATETGTHFLSFLDNSTTPAGGGMPPQWVVCIDDITIEEYAQPATCDDPTNLAVSEQNYTAATFTWDGTSEEYSFVLKDKGTTNTVFSQTVTAKTISVPRSYLQGLKEYTYSVAGVCGTLSSTPASADFTALKDSFDFSIAFPAQPYDNSVQKNMSAATSWNMTVKSGSTVAATNIAYQIIVFDTISKTQTIINDTIKTTVNANNGSSSKNNTLDFSAAPAFYQVSAIIIDDRDMNSANDTVKKSFTNHREDYGVTEIISPVSGNLLSNAETVKVAVKNFGTDTLRYFSFGVNLNDQLAGMLYIGTCAIGPDDTAHFTFDKTLDLSEFGDYNIVAYTEYQYNHDASNDSARVTVINSAPDGHKDALVTAILDPAFPVRLSATENIRVTVKNNSKDAVSNLSVKLIVNGEVMASDVIAESIDGLGEEYTHIFTNIDLSEFTEYTLKAFTELQDDVNTDNDTATKTITNLESSPDIPFVENFESPGDFELPQGWWENVQDQWYVDELDKLNIGEGEYTFNMKPKYVQFGSQSSSSTHDHWLITKGVTLVKGQSYKIRFNLYIDKHFASEGDDFEKLIVNIGNEQTVAGMLDDTLFVSEEKLYENEEVSTVFTADSTGVHYIGFHAVAETAVGYILIDSLTIDVEILNSLEILADKFPYTQVPESMTTLPALSAKAKNVGKNKQENVTLSVSLNSDLVGESSAVSEIAADATSETMTVASAEVEIAEGLNTLVYTVNGDATSDALEAENSVEFTFISSEKTLALDTVEAVLSGVGSATPSQLVGNVFPISETVKLNQVTIGFAEATTMDYTIELYKATGTPNTEGQITYNTTALFSKEASRTSDGFTTVRVPETELTAGLYFIGIKTADNTNHDIACDMDAAKTNYSTLSNGTLNPNKLTGMPDGALAIRMVLNDPEIGVNIEASEKSSTVSIYPNPVSDRLFIQAEENVKHTEIYNVQGKLVKVIASGVKEISVGDLKAGVYMLQVTTESGIKTLRFVKR